MPPVMVTDEEALAVVLGLLAGGRAGLAGLFTAAESVAAERAAVPSRST
jgi:predicted DNA-binding transcriptional regulator YafY